MKELYVSPEVEITCFAPVEGIALSNEPKLTSEEGSPVFNLPGDNEAEI